MGDSRRTATRAASLCALATMSALAACSLSEDFDGLTGGGGPALSRDASVHDAEYEAAIDDPDVSLDDTSSPLDAGGGGTFLDAAVDARVDAPIDASCTYRAITMGSPSNVSPAFGGDSGTPYDDPCPAGSALVGINGAGSDTSPGSLTQLQALCAPITASACGATFGAIRALSAHGDTTGPPATARCPAGNVVVGVSMRTGLWVDAIALHCAPLVVTSAGVSLGKVTTTVSVGGTGGSAAAPYDCPAPQFVERIRGGSGSFVDRIELVCATMAVP